jgi:hypothetical protein
LFFVVPAKTLKAEQHQTEVAERFGLLLEGYLRASGTQRGILLKQLELVQKMGLLSDKLRTDDVTRRARQHTLHQELSRMRLPVHFPLPIDPT